MHSMRDLKGPLVSGCSELGSHNDGDMGERPIEDEIEAGDQYAADPEMSSSAKLQR